MVDSADQPNSCFEYVTRNCKKFNPIYGNHGLDGITSFGFSRQPFITLLFYSAVVVGKKPKVPPESLPEMYRNAVVLQLATSACHSRSCFTISPK